VTRRARLTRDELERRLRDLADATAPEDLEPGAMCYSPAPQPDRWVYVCPTCGKRTSYALDGGWGDSGPPIGEDEPADVMRRAEVLAHDIQACLAGARRLPRSCGLRLVESPLCATCEPDAPVREPYLEARLPDEERARRVKLDGYVLRVVRAFLKGEDRYGGDVGAEYPLQEAVPLLRHVFLGETPPARADEGDDAE
jgi:hypothetical protein